MMMTMPVHVFKSTPFTRLISNPEKGICLPIFANCCGVPYTVLACLGRTQNWIGELIFVDPLCHRYSMTYEFASCGNLWLETCTNQEAPLRRTSRGRKPVQSVS